MLNLSNKFYEFRSAAPIFSNRTVEAASVIALDGGKISGQAHQVIERQSENRCRVAAIYKFAFAGCSG